MCVNACNNEKYETKTVMVHDSRINDIIADIADSEKRLFVVQGGGIDCYTLRGVQKLGRQSRSRTPDIAVSSSFVSREHGCFITSGDSVQYAADETTNGIYLNGKIIEPGTKITLSDGDELTVPADGSYGNETSVMMICAFSDAKIKMWQSIMEAQLDELTKLPNRKLFTERFNTYYLNSRRTDLWLFILDIDKFKLVNDVYGHASGDSALKLLASELKNAGGSIISEARWGGDEFVGVIEGTRDEAVKALDEVNSSVSSVMIEDRFGISISAGICCIGSYKGERTLEAMLETADSALYRSKQNGRKQVSVAE